MTERPASPLGPREGTSRVWPFPPQGEQNFRFGQRTADSQLLVPLLPSPAVSQDTTSPGEDGAQSLGWSNVVDCGDSQGAGLHPLHWN
jgi:hypothetical protein